MFCIINIKILYFSDSCIICGNMHYKVEEVILKMKISNDPGKGVSRIPGKCPRNQSHCFASDL